MPYIFTNFGGEYRDLGKLVEVDNNYNNNQQQLSCKAQIPSGNQQISHSTVVVSAWVQLDCARTLATIMLIGRW